MKWFISNNGFRRENSFFTILPSFRIIYNKNYFLETGVTTPAFGFDMAWIKWRYTLLIQQGY